MSLTRLATKYLTGGLRKYSNLHQGESCYIFGDGPSIKWFDLSRLGDLPGICCGMLPFHRDFRHLDIRYFTMVEPWLFAPRIFQAPILLNLRTIAAEYGRFVERTPNKQFFISLSNRPWLHGPNINYVYRGLPENRTRTDELLRGIDLFAGSFHASLSLAYYMGFKKIYLAGFDAWTIQPSRNLHWYELGEGEFFQATNLALDFLQTLARDVEIYTLSVDGSSRNVKNISYLTHTGEAPKFRENHELLDRHYLEVLATYPDYNIFPKQK